MGMTLSMPDTLWPLFAANPHLTRELPSIAASAIMIYGKVYKVTYLLGGTLGHDALGHETTLTNQPPRINLATGGSIFANGGSMQCA
jgi:hypothetical protein